MSQWMRYNLLSLRQRQNQCTQHCVIRKLSRFSWCHQWDEYFIS